MHCKWVQMVIALSILLICLGCVDVSKLPADRLPDPLILDLKVHGPKGRLLHFILDNAGELDYAGGVEAIKGHRQSLGTLDTATRLQLWHLFQRYNLASVKNQMFFTPKQVKYDLYFNIAGAQRKIITGDDLAPGMADLTALFNQIRDARFHDPAVAEAAAMFQAQQAERAKAAKQSTGTE